MKIISMGNIDIEIFGIYWLGIDTLQIMDIN